MESRAARPNCSMLSGNCPDDSAREGIAARLGDPPELVEQRTEDRLLVGKVVVDVSGRYARGHSDLAHRGGPIALMREQLQGGVEHLPPAALRLLVSLHDLASAKATRAGGRGQIIAGPVLR